MQPRRQRLLEKERGGRLKGKKDEDEGKRAKFRQEKKMRDQLAAVDAAVGGMLLNLKRPPAS